ncbi:unnamed protein product [Prorocentrum cordatum]|uniref:Uncharacterized protein n=1 Tax=Prorocentrum cordatum TaxID=2364126 RepID=A0ABN9VZ31_9DINO|nr:unnamed protein product [Polarella glacialis]
MWLDRALAVTEDAFWALGGSLLRCECRERAPFVRCEAAPADAPCGPHQVAGSCRHRGSMLDEISVFGALAEDEDTAVLPPGEAERFWPTGAAPRAAPRTAAPGRGPPGGDLFGRRRAAGAEGPAGRLSGAAWPLPPSPRSPSSPRAPPELPPPELLAPPGTSAPPAPPRRSGRACRRPRGILRAPGARAVPQHVTFCRDEAEVREIPLLQVRDLEVFQWSRSSGLEDAEDEGVETDSSDSC